MKREFLKDLGLEDEQIEKIMKSNGFDVGKAIEKAKQEAIEEVTAQFAPELEKLKSDSAELEKLRKETMSAEELTKKAMEDADAERVKYLKMQSEAKATSVLAKLDLDDESLASILPTLVTDDPTVTEQRANAYAKVFAEKIEAAKKAKEEELLKNTPEPPAGGGTPNPASGIQQKLEEAQANGDMASVAYYTRLAQQSQGG